MNDPTIPRAPRYELPTERMRNLRGIGFIAMLLLSILIVIGFGVAAANFIGYPGQ